jgi:hypothetical protein
VARGTRGAIDWIVPAATVAIAAALIFAPRQAGSGPLVAVALAVCATLALARRHQPLTYAVVVTVLLLASPWVKLASESVLHTERTFFGTYRVAVDEAAGRRSLAHGTTLHGTQRIEASRRGEPLSYYHRTGPLGRMMEAVPQLRQPGDVAAIGLGVGTLAAYAQPGQRWTFYEIDPAIERIARDDRYFTFLKD